MPLEELRYVRYARAFGWTPAQVDELPLDLEPWLLPVNTVIEQVADELAKERAEKARK